MEVPPSEKQGRHLERRTDVRMPCLPCPALALQDDTGVFQLRDAPDSRYAAQVGELRRDLGAIVKAAGCSAARLCRAWARVAEGPLTQQLDAVLKQAVGIF